MLGDIGFEILIIFLLALANGFFSGSEIAIVSSRKSRLETKAADGSSGARQAIDLADSPDRFLATVQVGITLIGTFAATFGGARISQVLAAQLNTIPALQPYAEPLSLLLVVAFITYMSLIFGELVPKRFALANAESFAVVAAPVMTLLSRLAGPVISFLTFSVNLVLRILGQQTSEEVIVTKDDIVYMLAEGQESGTVEAEEVEMIQKVFKFSNRSIRAVMTPRTTMTTIPTGTSLADIVEKFIITGYARLPVYDGTIDSIVGVLHIKDVLPHLMFGDPNRVIELEGLLLPAVYVLETNYVDEIMNMFRRQQLQMALVMDEHGQTSGLVTFEDLIEELVGEVYDEYDDAARKYIQRHDGSWLIDGLEPFDKVCDRLDIPTPEDITLTGFTTLAGLVLALLNHLPQEGDRVRIGDIELEVMDMDGHRIDKVLLRKLTPEETNAGNGSASA
jgi:putative hemolysin